jgi:Flp pilus assembly pilin Flp
MKAKFNEICIKLYCKADDAKTKARAIVRNDSGAVATEYALVIGVVVVGVILAATVMFDPLKEFFGAVIEKVKALLG